MGTRINQEMSLVLADIDDFAEVGPKPLDREQF